MIDVTGYNSSSIIIDSQYLAVHHVSQVLVVNVFDASILSFTNSDFQLNHSLFENIKTNMAANGLVLNCWNSTAAIGNSIFRNVTGAQRGGAVFFATEQLHKYLEFGENVTFWSCRAEVGGAIYHSSLTPSRYFDLVRWIDNHDANGRFNNIAGKPTEVGLELFVEGNNTESDLVEWDRVYSMSVSESVESTLERELRPGSDLSLKLQLVE
jgi:hypothetical protein